jgi:RNA polymerase sigma-70 factor (ECF subfamily)
MNTTSLSLLDRLKRAGSDAADWQRLQELYLPLIRAWLRRVPGVGDEADDLAQDVLVVLFRELPAFERRRDGSFRAWLRQITLNRIRAFQKSRGKRALTGGGEQGADLLAQLADPSSDLSRQWDEDHDKHVFQKLLAVVQPDFAPATWQAFTRFALDGRPAAQVAEELGLSASAVVQAKFRVLKRLRGLCNAFAWRNAIGSIRPEAALEIKGLRQRKLTLQCKVPISGECVAKPVAGGGRRADREKASDFGCWCRISFVPRLVL